MGELTDRAERPWVIPDGLEKGFYVIRFDLRNGQEFLTNLPTYRTSDAAFAAARAALDDGHNKQVLSLGVRHYDGKDFSDWGEQLLG